MLEGTFMPEIELKQSKIIRQAVDGYMLYDPYGMSVIITGEIHDGKKWLHISFAKPDAMPTYYDIQRVKENYLGKDRKAIMVFPEEKNHVNIHPYCLHLFTCISPGGDGLPEFSKDGSL